MEVQIALAANPDQVKKFFDRLESRGFKITTSEYGNPQAERAYRDEASGNPKCVVNVSSYKFGDGAGFYEYTAWVESVTEDGVTGEPVITQESNGFSITSQDNDRITRFVYFIDSVLTQRACVGDRG